MKWFRNLKIGSKLIAGFSIMILIMGIIGYTGFSSVNTINHKLDNIFSVRLPGIDNLIQTDRDLQQLLVAERSMIFANAKSEAFKQLVEDYEQNLQQADERWGKYKALPGASSEEEAIFPKYEKAKAEWQIISKKVVDGRTADTRKGRREALDLTLGSAAEKFEQMRDYLDQLTGINLELAAEDRDIASSTYQAVLISLLAFSGAGLLIGIFLMWGIGRGVTKPLKRVIEGLTAASDQVASGSNQVSAASQQLAEGSSEQASSIEETSSSLEEMSSMTRQNATNAGQADKLMKEANQVVTKANGFMSDLTGSMGEILKASEETSKIIKTIDEIAFQTNLLALNAAVEAARAGEAGAGFAVVADEVRNLAMRAADAAKNTADLIEGTVKKVKEGGDLVATTGETFTEVATSSEKVGALVAEIAEASTEQAEGIEQVNKAVSEMDKVVQQNAANAEESASASEEMTAQAEQLKTYVNDLAGLVGGNSDDAKNGYHDQAKVSKTGTKTRALVTSAQKPPAVHLARDVRPEQVIPMDDDFNDF
jgi:methyl-accepting chemotaxis protein